MIRFLLVILSVGIWLDASVIWAIGSEYNDVPFCWWFPSSFVLLLVLLIGVLAILLLQKRQQKEFARLQEEVSKDHALFRKEGICQEQDDDCSLACGGCKKDLHSSSLEAINESLQSAVQLKSEFIANINHEFRTPMNAILGYAEMLEDSGLAEREKRFVQTIHKNGLALLTILNDVMELAQIDSGGLEIVKSPTTVSVLIDEIYEAFIEATDRKHLTLTCEIDPNLPAQFMLDGIRIKQVLHNLVSNAIKFTTQGEVILRLNGNLTGREKKSYALAFTVEDTGTGIPEGKAEKLNILFSQPEKQEAALYGEFGLGLTLCTRLVGMMGGYMSLTSVPDQGALFTVMLPDVEPVVGGEKEQKAMLPVRNAVEARPHPHELSRSLLVVDDMKVISDIFIDYFTPMDIEVFSEKDGDMAVDIALREKPGLIFLDLNLQGEKSGLQVAQKLRATPETAHIPLILMTGQLLDREEHRSLFDDFLHKPFALDLVQQLVSQYLGTMSEIRPIEATSLPLESKREGKKSSAESHEGIRYWSPELDELFHKAFSSGTLSDARSLAEHMIEQGNALQDGECLRVGQELRSYALEPNILGVDELLSYLSQRRLQ